jgi:hypothetical protein
MKRCRRSGSPSVRRARPWSSPPCRPSSRAGLRNREASPPNLPRVPPWFGREAGAGWQPDRHQSDQWARMGHIETLPAKQFRPPICMYLRLAVAEGLQRPDVRLRLRGFECQAHRRGAERLSKAALSERGRRLHDDPATGKSLPGPARAAGRAGARRPGHCGLDLSCGRRRRSQGSHVRLQPHHRPDRSANRAAPSPSNPVIALRHAPPFDADDPVM